eukprot:902445_1
MEKTQTDYSYQFRLAIFDFPFADFLTSKQTPIQRAINKHPLTIQERQELIQYHTVSQAVRILSSYEFIRTLTPDNFLDYLGLYREPTSLTAQLVQELIEDYYIIKLNALTTVELLEKYYEAGTYTEFEITEPATIKELRNSIIKCLLS